MRAEVVAVGTELLIGQIVDTNSAWIGEQLALAGIDSTHQVKVGDNVGRIVGVLRAALERADAVVVCGGLGPTHDDVTRDALAEVMGVPLRRDPEALALLESVFAGRNREMPRNNLRQADVPEGATIIPQRLGTAPGLVCPVGEKVVFAVPGVPFEMKEMVERVVLPELRRRSGETSVIRSRTLRTWGFGESRLAEILAPRLEALEAVGAGVPTMAFLASGIEGIKVRLTVKAPDEAAALDALDAEEAQVRALTGPAVFGVDDETMEHAIGELLVGAGLRLAVAESFTGGLIASRVVAVPGASRWFAGGVVAYATEVKHRLLEVPAGDVVSEVAAAAMAEGVRRLLGADVGLATTGVAGPEPQEGKPPGTAFAGIALPGEAGTARALELVGGRARVREIGTITALDALRRRLLARG
ncbi:MAG: competence/damage-inducible protein A [Actinomycetota bacterium]|nr:competence/damage-inducible protein A [Actinomycetota bacterium]